MRIIIDERQEGLLESFVTPPGMRDRVKVVDSEKAELEEYMEKHGEHMSDVTNGKTYLVQYLRALSELVGKDYAVCAPVRSDGTYGAFYVKPFGTFRKLHVGSVHRASRGVPVKRNMYQRMGLNV